MDQARHWVDPVRRWWRMALEGSNPRWQANVRHLLRGAARRRMLSFDGLVRFELLSRRLLGQPLSIREWDRMTFTDKLTYHRLLVRDPVLQAFRDKLHMREYVTELLGAESLPCLIAVSGRPSQFAGRRGPYVLKANHGSGMVAFVDEGQAPSPEQLSEARRWLTVDYARQDLEWSYVGARPLLLAEEILRSPSGSYPPPDYKLFTFNGKVVLIEVVPGPDSGHRWMIMRPDWIRVSSMPPYRLHDDPDAARPPNLDLMMHWASVLGRDVDFVRVDMYDLGDRVLVGELTPCPGGGNVKFYPRSLDEWLGRMWRTKPRR